MLKEALKIKYLLFLLLIFCFFFLSFGVEALTHTSDTLSSSAPGVYTSHAIKFKTTKEIPPGGKIVIIPESGFFTFQGGFDYTDVDLSTSLTSGGIYDERELGASATAVLDGVSSVSATTTDANIIITLNSSFGISVDTYTLIELGANATYGDIGNMQIKNSTSTGSSYISVYTYDESNNYLERGIPRVYINQPITMTNYVYRKRMNGSPSGWLSNGTTQTIMALYTNYLATCRYSTASNTPYADMTDEFNYVGVNESYFHTVEINGLTNGSTYDYFIRCEDESGGRDQYTGCTYAEASTTPWFTASGTPIIELDCLDYWIQFSVSSVVGGVEEGGSGTGEGTGDGEGGGEENIEDTGGTGNSTGTGGGAPGGGGSGGGAGGGRGNERGTGFGPYLPYPPPPGAPGVVLEGWAYPNSEVIVLKDGQVEGRAKSSVTASFGAYLEELNQGVYTFSMWADDSAGRRSKTYSTTFWIDAGTQTTVSDIFLPPTIELGKTTISAGETLNVFGQTAPAATVEVWFYPKKIGEVLESEIIKKAAKADALGNWSALVGTSGISAGDYLVKAKANLELAGASNTIGYSDFGLVLDCAVDKGAEESGLCAGADLNGDGRVNITDFSILLYYWGTDNECADQNHNGTVDLIDFSIMMYYWTG